MIESWLPSPHFHNSPAISRISSNGIHSTSTSRSRVWSNQVSASLLPRFQYSPLIQLSLSSVRTPLDVPKLRAYVEGKVKGFQLQEPVYQFSFGQSSVLSRFRLPKLVFLPGRFATEIVIQLISSTLQTVNVT